MNIVYITYFLLFSIVLSVILIGASFFLVEKTPGEGKISTYECGFAPIKYPTSPFTIKFFVVGIIFLIFDLEIIYLIGWSYVCATLSWVAQGYVIVFFGFVVAGLAYEWVNGGLEWH